MSEMGELIAFLYHRLSDDKELALATYGAKWEVGPTFGARDNRVYVRKENNLIDSVGTCIIAGQVSNVPQFRANAAHIARWDPARALAEVEARQRIIDECVGAMSAGEIQPGTTWNDDAAGAVVGSHVLRLLASAHRDHPDYNPEWDVPMRQTSPAEESDV